MTQEIKPTYVTFEQAEKLKEKRFDVKVNTFFDLLSGNQIDNAPLGNYNLTKQSISIPEQWQVIEWLRVNHGIWINIEPEEYGQYYYVKLNVCSQELWEDLDKRHEVITAHRKFNNEHKTPQEAYSAAFDYILNDLI